MTAIYLAEITTAIDAAGTTAVLRFGSGAYNTHPGDSPPNVHYAPRLIQPALVRRELFGGGSIAGRARSAYGALELINSDGALDYLMAYSFGDREIVIKLGDSAAAYSTFTTILVASCEQAEFSSKRVSFKLRDPMVLLEKPALSTFYAANNVLPAGVEGTAELQGVPKPWLLGTVLFAEPVCVNTSRLIYQVSTEGVTINAIHFNPAVWDSGVALTAGATYANQAAMEATAPAAGEYRIWQDGGMFRLGASPVGRLVCSLSNLSSGSQLDTVVGQLAALVPAVSVDSGDLTALQTATGADVGLYVTGTETIAQLLDYVFGSVGAWWGFDATGTLRCGQLAAPSGTPAVSLTESEIIELESVAARDVTRGIPVWRVRLRYFRNWTPQDALASSVTPAARKNFASDYLVTEVEDDPAVLDQYANAVEYEVDTALNDSAGTVGPAEADRLLALLSVRRDTFECYVRLNTAIDLGQVVEVTHSRFNLSAGKLFLVVGIEMDLRKGRARLTLWG